MLIRIIDNIRSEEEFIFNYKWKSYEDISSNLALAVITAEDQKFSEHSGFDFEAIKKAYKLNERRGKIKKGGSTISNQIAKNVFLWPDRSWLRKGLEVYFTVLIELMWSKKRILEVYLNVVEMGRGIYGAESAAQIYFRESAKQLTKSESALIAAILPNPRKWKVNKPTPYITRRQQWILQHMETEFIDKINRRVAKQENH